MISIVIPLYNKEKLIANTLQSVFNQTFQQFEIIIVNDGSTDNSIAEVEKLNDNRIKIIHQKNAGVSAARNKGVQKAQFDLIAFLDADDEWKPDYLNTQYSLYLKYPECNVFTCSYEFKTFTEKIGSTIINKIPFKDQDGILSNYFEVASCSHPPICSISILVKKSAVLAIGGFPLGIKSGEDLLTWAKLAINNKIAYTKEILATYNLGNSIPRPPEEKDIVGLQLEELYQLNKKIKGLKKYCASWYKMRMCRCIAHNMYKKAWKAFSKSIKYNPLQVKIYASAFYYSIKK